MNFFQFYGLCSQAHDDPRLEEGNQQNSATFVQNGHANFQQWSAYVLAQLWNITRFAMLCTL